MRALLFSFFAIAIGCLLIFGMAFFIVGIVRYGSNNPTPVVVKTTPNCIQFEDNLVSPALIEAIIKIESGGDPNAVSPVGAIGLMQLMPVVYEGICGLTREEAFDPEKNVACGSIYVRHLLDIYDGDLEQTLRHYNSGWKKLKNGYAKRVIDKIPDSDGFNKKPLMLKND